MMNSPYRENLLSELQIMMHKKPISRPLTIVNWVMFAAVGIKTRHDPIKDRHTSFSIRFATFALPVWNTMPSFFVDAQQ
jgi:hypothetical protein